jgi:hypothetical protein
MDDCRAWQATVDSGGITTYLISGTDLMRLSFGWAVRSAAPSSFVVRAALLLMSAGLPAACSRFASHEDVFPPIPLTLGEARARGSDTVYALSGRGYELIAPAREILPDAQQILDGAARTFRRYMGEDPPRLIVEMRAAQPAAGPPPTPPAGPTRSASDTLILPLLRSRDERDVPRPPTYIARPVVRAWVAAYSTARAARAPATQTDTAGAGRGPGAPAWLLDALSQLVSPSPYQDIYLAQLSRQADDLIPLRTLFDSTAYPLAAGRAEGDPAASQVSGGPPPAGRPQGSRPPGGRPRGPSERLDRAALFAAESFAVARFLSEREGPDFIGDLANRVLGGERVENVLRDAKSVPGDLAAFESAWRSWLAARDQGGGRAGRE